MKRFFRSLELRHALIVLFMVVVVGTTIGFSPRAVVAQSNCTIRVGVHFFCAATSAATSLPTATPLAYDSTAGPAAMCVGGTSYNLAQDDEFANDTSTSFANSISATAQPLSGFTSPAIKWSTQLENIGRFNNPGVDTSYDVDPTSGKFGGYDPFVLTGSALQIVAEPVPSPYATDPVLVYPSASPQPSPHGYLSGSLQGPPFTYGYVEFQGEVPDGDAAWPAYWVIDPAGNTQPYPQIQELDTLEVFGTLFGSSVGQQTIIYHYAATPTPQSYYTRGTISPDVSTNYHTYGVLWLPGSPGTVTYYIDRVAQATYPATSSGPMNAILNLQVYAPGLYGQNPGGATFTMSTKYYRLYQAPTVAATCGPQASPVPTATPTPTPAPSPSAQATNVALVQSGTANLTNSYGSVVGTVSATPGAGHLLVNIAATNNGLTMPTGWTALDSSPNLSISYCIVGSNGCTAATSYNFTGNGAIDQLFEFSGQSGPPQVGTDTTQYGSPATPSITIPAAGGITFIADGFYAATGYISGATDTLPNGFTESAVTGVYDQAAGSDFLGLRIVESNQEAHTATQPWAAAQALSGTYTGQQINSNILWIP